MKLIEFFKWDFEGEYQQYFYVTKDEDKFIKEVLTHLNTVSINNEFFWADVLDTFQEENRVDGYFFSQPFFHLNEYYHIQDDDGKFSITKITMKYESEDFK